MNEAHCHISGALLILLMSGCSDNPSTEPVPAADGSGKPVVVTTSFPLYAMTSVLGGDEFDVRFPMENPKSPRSWTPSPPDIRALQQADLILLNGAGYELWLPRLTLPRSRMVDVSAEYRDSLIALSGETNHQHGPGGTASDVGTAWATWLAPDLAVRKLDQIAEQLTNLRPDSADAIIARADRLHAELMMQYPVELTDASQKPTVVLADGPFYYYLGARLNWKIHSLSLTDTASDDRLDDGFRAATEKYQPHLLVYRKDASDETIAMFSGSTVPAIAIDVCETEVAGVSLVERLRSNFQAVRHGTSEARQSEVQQ